MALKTINDLTANTAPASTDLLGVWVAGAGAMRKTTLAQVVTQAGIAALKATTNTFTKAQTIAPDSSVSALNITPAAGAGVFGVVVAGLDNGADSGARIYIGENTNGSTPASGSLVIRNIAASARYIWPDVAGLLRISSSPATNATDTGGTVVGAQTSHAAFKDVVGEPIADADALASVIAAAETIKRFVYKSGAYGGQEFSGIVLDGDYLQRYGQDADAEHPAGKSLNIINAIGDMMLALREIERRLTALEA